MEQPTRLDIIHLLVRHQDADAVRFLVYRHGKWPYLTLPTKKVVADAGADIRQGSSLEHFLEDVLCEDLKLPAEPLEAYTLEQELEPARALMESPRDHRLKEYTIYPVDVWVAPHLHEDLRKAVPGGQWVTCADALDLAERKELSPTAAAVFRKVLERDKELAERYARAPEEERRPEAPRRLLQQVPAGPTMDGLARKWLSHNRGGVRHLREQELDKILGAGGRALNLRVADPYLRYQLQGLGFTWSFFTHKDPQDLHVHGAPVVEVYGVLEGRLEVWWKAYYDRGTSAWCHRVLEPGDWLEVDALQCHIVRWLGEGKGVAFKAGPGPLAEVGRLGVKGKTPCGDCTCMKPPEVVELNKGGGHG